jgi:hypothetical protein
VCYLKKAIYDLKTGPKSLVFQILELGVDGLKSDNSLFIYKYAEIKLLELFDIDDII